MGVIFLKDFNNPNVRREIIMSHYSSPRLKSKLERNDLDAYSNHCVDELHIQWEFEGDRLKTAKWDGVGCAVFQSSSDIFLETAIGKTKEEIQDLAVQYENLINQNGKEYDAVLLDELMVFKNVKVQLNRLNCANLVSQVILKK